MSSEPRRLTTPLSAADVDSLRIGDQVLLSGVLYTARDAAHARLVELIKKGEKLPFDPAGQVIYFVGPTPPPPGKVIGSCGPTTSYRMDPYSPYLIEKGLRGMIGKGKRAPEVVDAMKKHGAAYFGATGGAGALIAGCVKESEIVAYEDLGPEAIRRLVVKDFPLVVIIDRYGDDLYQRGRAQFEEKE
jgi:fumarate hydratase subunit beta